MRRWLSDQALFFGEFFRTFHTTGAVLPSGPRLARALVRFVREPGESRRILEVGPGTGAVTCRLVDALRHSDRFDLVELNDRFVERLRHRFATERPFQAVAERANIFHCPVQDLKEHEPYDLIVSGLPFNNFPPELVESILQKLLRLLKPGGTLSFFEYIAVRAIKSAAGRRAERARIKAISRVLQGAFDGREFRRDWVWLNVPPAWVHHLRKE